MKITFVRSFDTPDIFKWGEALSKMHNINYLIWNRYGTLKEKENMTKLDIKVSRSNFRLPFFYPIWWLYEFFFLVRDDAEIIHACDLDTLLPAILVKLFRKTKIYYTIFDFYGDTLPHSYPQFVGKLIGNLERFCIMFTDSLFLVDESRFEQIKGSKAKEPIYIYNSPHDISYLNPDNPDTEKEIVIFYAGLLDEQRGLKYLIKALDNIEGVKLLIAGNGQCESALKNISEKNKGKIEFLGYMPYKDVLKKTTRSDIIVALYDPKIPINTYASPNKLFESMMCGKPIIGNELTSMAKIVQKEKCGIIISYGDVEALQKSILSLKNNPEFRFELGKNGREAYEERYSWEIMEKKLMNAYNGDIH